MLEASDDWWRELANEYEGGDLSSGGSAIDEPHSLHRRPPRKRQCAAPGSPSDATSTVALPPRRAVGGGGGAIDGLVERLERLMVVSAGGALGEPADGGGEARLVAALEMSAKAEDRIAAAEEAAADARDEVSRLTLQLQAAPSAEALARQAREPLPRHF